MKKLYTAILIISLVLFISCDEKKAEDDITKAIEKIEDKAEDVADKATPKKQGSGTLTNIARKPALSGKLVPWSEPILFPKIPDHTYTLKEKKTGVAITEYSSETMQLTATQSAQNVIIVATLDGKTSESDPIEFTRKQGNTLSFAQASRTERRRATFTQTASKSGTVAGDTRNIKYSISPADHGVIIDSSSGKVRVADKADTGDYTITAELQQNEKYERSTATYKLLVSDDFAR